ASSSSSSMRAASSPSPFTVPSSSPFGRRCAQAQPAEVARTRHAKAAYVALAVVGRTRGASLFLSYV
ncbi:hypothetical protein K438DRAFT_1862317, partial [Mycena galopus ATCC 62051]